MEALLPLSISKGLMDHRCLQSPLQPCVFKRRQEAAAVEAELIWTELKSFLGGLVPAVHQDPDGPRVRCDEYDVLTASHVVGRAERGRILINKRLGGMWTWISADLELLTVPTRWSSWVGRVWSRLRTAAPRSPRFVRSVRQLFWFKPEVGVKLLLDWFPGITWNLFLECLQSLKNCSHFKTVALLLD